MGRLPKSWQAKTAAFITWYAGQKTRFFYRQVTRLASIFFINTTLQFIDKRTDTYFDPNTFEAIPVTLQSYALWNAYAEYRLAEDKLRLFIDAKNLTNKTNYYEVYGYNVQGFTINTGIHFKL